MNSFIITFCCLAVAFTSGGVIKHIPSGSVGVSADGALVVGPAGSVHTNNGLYGHGAGVQVSGPSGDLDTRAGNVIIKGPGHLDNTWGHDAEEGEWEHADNGEWHEEDHKDKNHGDDEQWKAEEHKDWINEEEEKKWDAEEEQQWDDNEAQWTEEHNEWHKLVKRDVSTKKISNGPEGRWNKEEERYVWNDNSKNNENSWSNDNADDTAPFGIPAWSHW